MRDEVLVEPIKEFDEVFLCLLELLRKIETEQNEPIDYVKERGRLRDKVEALKTGSLKRDQLAAKALTAWIDESLINSSWSKRKEWENNTLWVDLYGAPRTAATEFFIKFKEARDLPRDQRESMEVFYLCVALGFQGLYSDDKRDWFVRENELPETLEKWVAAAAAAINKQATGLREEHRIPAGAPPLEGRLLFLSSGVVAFATLLALAVVGWWWLLRGG